MTQHAGTLSLLDRLSRSDRVKIIHNPGERADWGYFGSREEAEQVLRSRKYIAHQNDNLGPVDIDVPTRVHSHDYPAMFFLQKLAAEGRLRTVTEVVGQLGPQCHRYGKYVDFPRDFSWQTLQCSALKPGPEHFSSRDGAALHPPEHPEDIGSCDVLICSGVLAYLDIPFEQIVRILSAKPPMILLNQMSVARQPGFYMLESIGGSKVLHRTSTQPEIEQIRKNLGYRLVSRWDIPERSHVLSWLNETETVQMIGEAWSL